MTVLVPYSDTSRVRLADIDGRNSDTQAIVAVATSGRSVAEEPEDSVVLFPDCRSANTISKISSRILSP